MNKLYLNIESEIESFFRDESIDIPQRVSEKLLTLISVLTIYEEEEIKVFPKIIIGNNVVETVKKYLTNRHVLQISEEDLEGNGFEKKIKSLIPFCNMGWHVFIDVNIEKSKIIYGIVRSFTGITGFDLQSQIFDDNEEKMKLLFIETLDKSSLIITGSIKNLIVDFKIYDDTNVVSNRSVIDQLSADIVSDLNDLSQREEVKKVFNKFFTMAQKKIHGTILLVVDEKNTLIPDAIKDGNWLHDGEFIDIADSSLKVLEGNTNHTEIEKHYSLTGLIIAMMNIDGITVLNSKGQVIGYNVFLKQTFVEQTGVSGGARKRTALSLKELNDQHFKIKGVYFQSQDGYAQYERIDQGE